MKKLCFLFCLLILVSCKQNRKSTNKIQSRALSLAGQTMGTSYSIKYLSPTHIQPIKKKVIDSILISINEAVSTYEPNSTITRLNQSGKEGITVQLNKFPDQHFITNYFSALEVYENTEGYFDPSIMPLVNYWGFGYEGKNPVTEIDSNEVNRRLAYIGLDFFEPIISKNEIVFTKKDARSTLDFSAIAKGYAVDYLADFIETKSISSYMVEIGGEVKVKGLNNQGTPWKLGINTPEENAKYNDIQFVVSPKSKALASSGNYRIFHKIDDVSYGHELNPKTGFPQVTDILSASVIHDQCMYADAYATAFMIMGLEKTLEYVRNNDEMEVCLIVKEDGELTNIYSEGFGKYLLD